MEVIASVLLLGLCVSAGVNVVLYYKSKQPKIEKKETLELQEFLADLLSGNAVIQVTRIAPVDVLIRSPRGR